MKNSATMLIGLVVLVLIILSPLALVWALNTLFALSIGYTFKTWLAALIIISTVKTVVHKK